MVTEPEETKNFLIAPSFSNTVTTPGLRTANEGTWLGKIPKDPEKEGTSICLTAASCKENNIFFNFLNGICWMVYSSIGLGFWGLMLLPFSG